MRKEVDQGMQDARSLNQDSILSGDIPAFGIWEHVSHVWEWDPWVRCPTRSVSLTGGSSAVGFGTAWFRGPPGGTTSHFSWVAPSFSSTLQLCMEGG